MASITDRQGHLVATVDVETGAFEWQARELALQPAADEGEAIADQCRWVAEEPR